MSVPDEKADAAIRGLLSRYPRPALGSDFSSGVLRRVSEHEREGVRSGTCPRGFCSAPTGSRRRSPPCGSWPGSRGRSGRRL